MLVRALRFHIKLKFSVCGVSAQMHRNLRRGGIFVSVWFSALTALVVLVDQALKYFVRLNLKPIGRVTAIDGLLTWSYVENRGAAFGFLAGHIWLLVPVTLLLLCGILYLVFSKKISDALLLCATSLIAGGGLGNLLDRIFLGYVVDFIKLSFFPPVFNFADVCITLGAALFFICTLRDSFSQRAADKKEKQK